MGCTCAMERWRAQPWFAFERSDDRARMREPERVALRLRGDSPQEHERNPFADNGALYMLSKREAIALLGTLLDVLDVTDAAALAEELQARPGMTCAAVRRLRVMRPWIGPRQESWPSSSDPDGPRRKVEVWHRVPLVPPDRVTGTTSPVFSASIGLAPSTTLAYDFRGAYYPVDPGNVPFCGVTLATRRASFLAYCDRIIEADGWSLAPFILPPLETP